MTHCRLTLSTFFLVLASSLSFGQNLISNGNFETGNTSPWQGFKNQVLTDDITNSQVGNINNGDGSLYQVFNVIPTETYTVAFDYRWVNSGSTNMTARVMTGASGGSSIVLFDLNQASDVWFENANFNFTVPVGIDTVRLIFFKTPGNQPIRIDNVFVGNSNSTLPFFVDQDTPINAQPHGPSGEWNLDFSDEFNSTSLDLNKWMVSVSSQSRAPRPNLGVDDWWWVQNNAFLDGNGELTLRATKEDFNTMFCGSVETRDIYETTYGFMEARIKIAETAKGNHTAFWLQGENMGNVDNSGQDGAEIDIFESAWVTDDTKAVIHFDGYGPNKHNHTIPYDTPGLHSGYHIFGMLWEQGSIRIFYDGQEVTSTNPNKPFPFTVDSNGYPVVPEVPEWLWLSVGASFGDGDFINQPVGVLSDAKVDWIRVFKNSETLDITQTLPQTSIAVYPNPTHNTLYIDTDIYLKEATFYTSQGKKIRTIQNLNFKDFIDVSDFESGIYLLKFETNNGSLTKKVIIK